MLFWGDLDNSIPSVSWKRAWRMLRIKRYVRVEAGPEIELLRLSPKCAR